MRILETPSKSAIATIAALAGAAFSGYAVPGVTAIAPVRRTLFRRLSGVSSSSALALTFDDGPDPKSTPMFLDRLEGLGWKATFFMLGSMAEREPALAREVQARGHEIALHGYLHKNLLWRTPGATDGDIRKGFDTIATITGTTPRFYRPPYGVLNTQALLTTRPLYNAGVKFSHELPSLVNQAQTGTGRLGVLIRRFHVDTYVQANSSKLTSVLSKASGPALVAAKTFLSGIARVVTIFLLSLFIEIEAPLLFAALYQFVGPDKRSSLMRVRQRLVKAITGYVLGNLATSVIAGIVVYAPRFRQLRDHLCHWA